MKSRAKDKKAKNETKVRDLKPTKDPKGGLPSDPRDPRRPSSARSQLPAIQ
jgi:hypothetical protein